MPVITSLSVSLYCGFEDGLSIKEADRTGEVVVPNDAFRIPANRQPPSLK
jgi:hypothetical protein